MLSPDGLAKATPQDWPNLPQPDEDMNAVSRTGMYKGAFHASYSEVREEIASGKMKLYGHKMSTSDLNVVRNQYGFQSRMLNANLFNRPSCRFQYDDLSGGSSMRGCAVDVNDEAVNGVLAADSLVVGWAYQPRSFERCFAGAGAQPNGDAKGSFQCPGKPNGKFWARVWFR